MRYNKGNILIESLLALLICGLIVNVYFEIINTDNTMVNIEKLYEEGI